LICWAIMQSIF